LLLSREASAPFTHCEDAAPGYPDVDKNLYFRRNPVDAGTLDLRTAPPGKRSRAGVSGKEKGRTLAGPAGMG